MVDLWSDRPVTLNELIWLLGGGFRVEPALEQVPAQPGDAKRIWVDIRARALLGYEPRTPLHDWIRKFVEWLGIAS